MSSHIDALASLEEKMGKTSKEGFPVEVFPRSVQELIANAENTVNFPPDFLSAGILSVSASAIGNTVKLDNGSYMVKTILWISIVGEPGTNKTHPLTYAVKPLNMADEISKADYDLQMDGWNKESTEKKPVFRKQVLQDFTPEKLGQAMQYNDKGVLIYRDELMEWINSFNRYSSAGEQQMYLNLLMANYFPLTENRRNPFMFLRPALTSWEGCNHPS